MKKKKLLFSTAIIFCSIALSCSDDNSNPDDTQGLIATDAQLVNFGSGYSFTEGPAVDKNGNVFFTDQPNDIIYKWNASTGAIAPF
jgi:gluconolactonase